MNLNQVTIPSLDIKKSIAFYKDLGLDLIVASYPKYARFECPDGEATFSIHLVEQLPSGSGILVYFEVEDVDKKIKELRAKHLRIDSVPKDQTWLWREAHLIDPDGNKIIIFHAGKNRKNPPWRIKTT